MCLCASCISTTLLFSRHDANVYLYPTITVTYQSLFEFFVHRPLRGLDQCDPPSGLECVLKFTSNTFIQLTFRLSLSYVFQAILLGQRVTSNTFRILATSTAAGMATGGWVIVLVAEHLQRSEAKVWDFKMIMELFSSILR